MLLDKCYSRLKVPLVLGFQKKKKKCEKLTIASTFLQSLMVVLKHVVRAQIPLVTVDIVAKCLIRLFKTLCLSCKQVSMHLHICLILYYSRM